MNKIKRGNRTHRHTITLRDDVYQKLRDFKTEAMKSEKLADTFLVLRTSTLITLIVDWALTEGKLGARTIVELYAKSHDLWARIPEEPYGDEWKNEKEKQQRKKQAL